MQCHSTTGKRYVEQHADQIEQIRNGEIGCIDCHNDIHPLALSRRPGARKEAAR
jgi:nitrate/TMAO reductase-like tetraheme cytochrome c subunit